MKKYDGHQAGEQGVGPGEVGSQRQCINATRTVK
jgi:hypothetical protein